MYSTGSWNTCLVSTISPATRTPPSSAVSTLKRVASSPGMTAGGSKVSAVHSITRAGCRASSPLATRLTTKKVWDPRMLPHSSDYLSHSSWPWPWHQAVSDVKGREIIAPKQVVCNGSPSCSKPVGPTCFFGVGIERHVRDAGAIVCGVAWGWRKGWWTAQDRVNGPWDISQTGRALGWEPRTGCWPRPMAERVVDGTLMDTSIDRRTSSMVPGLQLHHVARFCSRELASFASAATPGVVIDLDLEIPTTSSCSAIWTTHSCVPQDLQ